MKLRGIGLAADKPVFHDRLPAFFLIVDGPNVEGATVLESGPIARAWKRVVEAAGSEEVLSGRVRLPVDRRENLAEALGSLRIEIRNSPAAEAQLQRRLRWVVEHAGPGTQFHEQLDAVVVALMAAEKLRPHERRDLWELRRAATTDSLPGRVLGRRRERCFEAGRFIEIRVPVRANPIRSLLHLREIEASLRRLIHRPEASEVIATAMKTVDQLLKLAKTEEVDAADALVGLDEMGASGRFDAIVDEAIVESIPLGGVGRLAELLVESSPAPGVPPFPQSSPARTAKASAEDIERWKFAKPLREKDDQVSWKTIADQYRKKTGKRVDESSMKQACQRAKTAEKQAKGA